MRRADYQHHATYPAMTIVIPRSIIRQYRQLVPRVKNVWNRRSCQFTGVAEDRNVHRVYLLHQLTEPPQIPQALPKLFIRT